MANGRIVVRVDGEAPQINQFLAGVSRTVDTQLGMIEKKYSNIFRTGRAGGPLDSFAGIKTQMFEAPGRVAGEVVRWGSSIKTTRFEVDSLNNSLKVTSQVALRLKNGDIIPIKTISRQFGEATQFLDAFQKKQEALYQIQDAKTARDAAKQAAANARAQAEAGVQTATANAQNRRRILDELRTRRNSTALRLQAVNARLAAMPAGPLQSARLQALYAADMAEQARLQGLLQMYNRRLPAAALRFQQAQQALAAAMADPRITQYPNLLRTIEQNYRTSVRGLADAARTAGADLNKIMTAPLANTPIGYQNLPAGIRKQLSKAGLSPNADYMVNKQMATFNTPYRDMERGLTHFSGEYMKMQTIGKQTIPVMQKWSATVDDQGKIVQSTSRNLRGFSRIIDQIGRDFQKVIEWTVATTLIFGSLQAIGQASDIIKNLDADLTRFSITAGLTAKATKEFYNSMLEVAQLTATPIEELIKAADDFALAVKKPNQSVKELQAEILTLAKVVGIYTNLTGEDTVSATDQLVAVMKQFGYSAAGVYSILNKVTAAAGGQSGAIADITKGLSVMAEAGEQANLTVDQQIGVIKTLSQVTSKSPAEVATAFKNLVGALENPAALKALEKYNIGLISQGNSIIDIYRQIAEKISSGDIAQGDVSGLLRAISGGPRRAPDAAALLANINQVLKETAVSAAATNEGFLANALVLDTLQAKLTVLGNTLKDKTFTQFGQVFKDALTIGADVLNNFLTAFGEVSPAVIAAATSVGVLLVAFQLMRRGIIATSTAIEGLSIATIKQSYARAQWIKDEYVLYLQTQLTNKTLKERAIILGNMAGRGIFGAKTTLKGGLAQMGVSAALGGGMAAMAGGGLPQIAGTGLSMAGMGMLALPEPTMVTKVAGVLMILGGAFLSMQQEAESSADAMEKNAQAMYGIFQAATQASSALTALNKDQALIRSTIEELQKGPKTSDTTAQLAQQYQLYAENILAAADAQTQLNDAIEEFTKLAEENPAMGEFSARVLNAMRGGATEGEIRQLRNEMLNAALKNTFPNYMAPEGVRARTINTNQVLQGSKTDKIAVPDISASTGTNDLFNLTSGAAFGGASTSFTASTIEKMIKDLNEADVKSFFTEGADGALQFNSSIAVTASLIDQITEIINKMPEGDKLKYGQAFDEVANSAFAFKAAADYTEYYKTVLENLTLISPEVRKELEGIVKVMEALIASDLSKTDPKKFASMYNQLSTEFAKVAQTGQVSSPELLNKFSTMFAEVTGGLDGIKTDSEGFDIIIQTIGKDLWEWLLPLMQVKDTFRELTTEGQAALDAINNSIDSALTSVATKSMEARQQLVDKEIDKADYTEEINQLNAYASTLERFRQEVNSAAEIYGQDFIDGLNAGKAALSKIPGLQDAAYISIDQLVGRMLDAGLAADFSGKKFEAYAQRVWSVMQSLLRINKIKAMFRIDVTANTNQAAAQLEKLAAQADRIAGLMPMMAGPLRMYASILRTAAKTLRTDQKNVSSFKLPRPARTPTTSSGGGGGGGPDYSELDLPEELSGLPNRDSLIRQAIRNARALQRKIPGASKEAKNDVVTILDGMKKLETVRGVREDLLRRALEDLANIEKKRLEMETKADTIRRIRVGAGDFAAIANVPVNSKTGVSMGGPEGPVNVTLNLNGTVLTPAQFEEFANKIAAAIARQVAKG